ncbi:MAG: transketolase [Nitrospiraceae bacterium]|nr:transketolase [Nitrospiraceae bacterium]
MNTDELCINTIRMLSVDMVQKANSGHPGMPMGAAPMAYVLWTRFMRSNPENPFWPDRDRFVLSAGHGSALLYAMLHLSGYDMPMDEIKNFRQWGSHTPGHPEYDPKRGIECTTGPLGQGFGDGIGMAMAERFLSANFNRPGHEVVNHYTYAICSDGDLMEGISNEAGSLAGHFKLGKLIYLYDNNHISLAGAIQLTFTEDAAKRFDAYGWHVLKVEDGNDLEAISGAIQAAREELERPSLIIVTTHIAYGSPHKQDTFQAHGSPLGEEEVRLTKQNLGWPVEPAFHVPEEALKRFREAVPKGRKLEDEWNRKMEAYKSEHPDLSAKWDQMWAGKYTPGWKEKLPVFSPSDKPVATRTAGGMAMNAIYEHVPQLIGGSADLNPSTDTALQKRGTFESPDMGSEEIQGSVGKWDFKAPNIAYGVREHAMTAATSGLALHGGLLPFASTFLIFSDYMRPSIRLACLMKLHVIYVFTHDSVALGEDGPTHQPVEHLQSLRAMPNMTVIRPADANETSEAWSATLEHKNGPVSIILTRQKLPIIDRRKYAHASGLHKGGYILAGPASEKPEIILIATGSEVHPALKAYETLAAEGVKARLVSMPCQEFFDRQPESYRNEVLPPDVTERIAIEAAATSGWYKYVGAKDYGQGLVIGIDRFGASAPGEINMKEFGFTTENILEKARSLLGRKVKA